MKVWLDLANSPHVLILKPVADELEAQGHEVVVTLRDFAQTIPLAERHDLAGPVIGAHGGSSRWGKAKSLTGRTLDLRRFAAEQGVDRAMSHNSYAQAVAARSLGIHTVTMMDYEGQPANHVAFRAANRVVVPERFPTDDLRRFGAREKKVRTFPGLKEQLYLAGFEPDRQAIERELEETCGAALGDGWRDRPLVVVRPPATMAYYHRFENPIFPTVLDWLDRQDVQVVAIPRDDSQIDELTKHLRRVAIPSTAVDGPSLIERADLVISAGGTMNREAAVLGTPAYTIFAGDLPAVDEELIRLGRLESIGDPGVLDSRTVEHKQPGQPLGPAPVLEVILDALQLEPVRSSVT